VIVTSTPGYESDEWSFQNNRICRNPRFAAWLEITGRVTRWVFEKNLLKCSSPTHFCQN
jgi:hypothetical protein